MAFSCFPEALCFSCCSMCYPMVLVPTSYARGLQCFLPGELFTARLRGCLALGREQELEKRQRGAARGPVVTRCCPSDPLLISPPPAELSCSPVPLAAPHQSPAAAPSVKATAFSCTEGLQLLAFASLKGRAYVCLRRHIG